jgi:hypothetical protein
VSAAANTPDGLTWRKSSFSGGGGEGGGDCVELAPLIDGSVAVRDSKNPRGGILTFTRAEMRAWISACKAGEFDDLT